MPLPAENDVPDAPLKPVGLLNPETSAQRFQLTLRAPSKALAPFVEHYWRVRWDLSDLPSYRQENLPHPSVHVVFERGRSAIYGVMRGKFAYLLEGRGQVFGIKFKPGGFQPFWQAPVAELANTTAPIDAAFAVDAQAMESELLALDDEDAMVAMAEAMLLARRPQPTPQLEEAERIIRLMREDRQLTKVDDVAQRFGLSTRGLQRLFSQYVGASPKWVLQRYRLLEVAEQLASGEHQDWPQLALELGYFDQAHFSKDFKAIVGQAPAEYLLRLGGGR